VLLLFNSDIGNAHVLLAPPARGWSVLRLHCTDTNVVSASLSVLAGALFPDILALSSSALKSALASLRFEGHELTDLVDIELC
jgi:hypothetical protein